MPDPLPTPADNLPDKPEDNSKPTDMLEPSEDPLLPEDYE